MSSEARPLTRIALVAAAIALAVYLLWLFAGGSDRLAEVATSEDNQPLTAALSEASSTETTTVAATTSAQDDAEPAPDAVVDAAELSQDTDAQEVVAEAAAEPPAPAFDTFRISPDGEALIAGRAVPGQVVDVMLSGTSIAQAVAGGDGSFVAFASIVPSNQPRTLGLLADAGGAAMSSAKTFLVEPFGIATEPAPETDTVVVAGAVTDTTMETPEIAETAEEVNAEPSVADAEAVAEETAVADAIVDSSEPEPAKTAEVEATQSDISAQTNVAATDVAEPAPAEATVATTESAVVVADTATETQVAVTTDTSTPAVEAAGDAETVAEPASSEEPTVLVADAEGVRVVAPSQQSPQALTSVALDSITYDPAGEVLLAGRASAGGFVQVYIDNKPVTSSRIGEAGDWRTDLPEVDTGVYTLRIDEVDAAGDVVSRIETPFKREEPAAVAAVMAEETAQEGFEVAVKTVQPGSTLWAIAREKYGEGILYVAVFEENRDLIKDPDLIYPGQVFRLPEITE